MKKRLFLNPYLAIVVVLSFVLLSCNKEDTKPEPTPDFTFEVDDKQVTFTNTSEDADSYSWDFDDENTSTEENPVHTYDAYGDYDVRLTATGPGGSQTKKQTISVVKEWPAISIDGDFSDWNAVESFYSGYGDASGTLTEMKVTSDAAGSKLYFYIKGTMNAAYPVIQIMIDADGDTLTGWKTPTEYASNGAEYQFEFYVTELWCGVYSWSSDPGSQDWPWVDDITTDPTNGDISESSAIIGETEIEFAIETSLMKDPVLADKIGIFIWAQPEDWSDTAGSLPPVRTDPLYVVKLFSFQ
jgi:PKD repeat protein